MLNVLLDLVDFIALRYHTVRFGAWLGLNDSGQWMRLNVRGLAELTFGLFFEQKVLSC